MTKAADGRPNRGHIAFLLAQLGGLAALRFAEHLAPLHLTPPHAGLLRAVSINSGRSQQALATQLGILPSKLVALVDDLEQDGLLERRRNPDDRRNHALHPTAKGRERLADIGRAAQTHGAELLAPLGPSDIDELTRILRRLADHHELAEGVHPGYQTLGRPTARPDRS